MNVREKFFCYGGCSKTVDGLDPPSGQCTWRTSKIGGDSHRAIDVDDDLERKQGPARLEMARGFITPVRIAHEEVAVGEQRIERCKFPPGAISIQVTTDSLA